MVRQLQLKICADRLTGQGRQRTGLRGQSRCSRCCCHVGLTSGCRLCWVPAQQPTLRLLLTPLLLHLRGSTCSRGGWLQLPPLAPSLLVLRLLRHIRQGLPQPSSSCSTHTCRRVLVAAHVWLAARACRAGRLGQEGLVVVSQDAGQSLYLLVCAPLQLQQQQLALLTALTSLSSTRAMQRVVGRQQGVRAGQGLADGAVAGAGGTAMQLQRLGGSSG